MNENDQFPGLQSLLSAVEDLQPEDVNDDLEGEQETLPDLTGEDLKGRPFPGHSQWREVITGVSKGVTEKTDGDYERTIRHCGAYLVSANLIQKSDVLFCKNPPEQAPDLIIACIMDACDEFLLDGTQKPKDTIIGTYSHAQKIRAAMTHTFGRIYELGSIAWHQDESTGRWRGNPSISLKVSRYMISLRNRKTRAGETPTSARAITSDVIKKLYEFNNLPENYEIQPYAPGRRNKASNLHEWGGPTARRELQVIYAVAFLCLLRSDEVLKIRREHVYLNKDPDNLSVTLTLPFRKTHQDGGIKPFVLYPLSDEEAHLCPVRAMASWIDGAHVTDGYIFRKIASGDRVAPQDIPLTSEQFLEMFRNNLLDVGVDPTSYGTHSFRRGGCQYLSAD